MKRFITILLCLAMSGAVIYKLDTITDIASDYFNSTPTLFIDEKNKYAKNEDYKFVQIKDDFIPYNYQDLLNIFYTILDSGYKTFTFYCPVEYEDCVEDVEKLSNKSFSEDLTTISNYVSPYNSFKSINVTPDSAGEVLVEIEYWYSDTDIANINQKLDVLWNDIVTQDMSNEDIIYAFHDYIINNTKYDTLYEQENKAYQEAHQAEEYSLHDVVHTHDSARATGPLFEGYAICSGYTDLMALILDRLNIKNFRISSDTHVWNAVYINDSWKHLDLTWDDPVSNDVTQDFLLHKFFLIDTATLEEFDISDHSFNKSTYLEIK